MSAALFGVAIIAIINALFYASSVNARNSRYVTASAIASQQIEALRAQTFDSLTTPYNGSLTAATQPAASSLPNGAGNLVVSYYNGPTNTIKQAVVTVSWSEKGQTRRIQYTTLLVANGVGQ
jgi:uncharacterized membrane protein